MNEMKNTDRFTEKEWVELASSLSGENNNQQTDIVRQFMSEDEESTGKKWEALRNMSDEREINVDAAWNKVHNRLKETGTFIEQKEQRVIIMRRTFLKIAAAAVILLSLGALAIYLVNTGLSGKDITLATGNYEKNVRLDLPDGSTVYLNRNSELTYPESFRKAGRSVLLKGEAFFEIAPDRNNPFTVDAGQAKVKVTGTSFNVITNNQNLAVEVFVNTGQVVLSDNAGNQNLILDPGYIGTLDSKASEKKLNTDLNYMSWKTGRLGYNGQKLGIVFRDLKRVYNLDIIADDPQILNNPWTWTSPEDNMPQDIIIQLICTSFNLSYSKDGNVYHLAKK